MNTKNILLKFIAFTLSINANAQGSIDDILAEISKNNKTIQATAQFYDAKNLQYKTGLTPDNPTVEYDFLAGSPVNAGKQHDLTISQQFDFPTTYIRKKQLAKIQTAQSEFLLSATRQDILLEAKKVCIGLVYLNKLRQQLMQLKQNTEKILTDFQTKLEKGDGNILDVNKARLQLIEIRKQSQQNISDITQHNQKLMALNGGNQITFADTTYQIPPSFPTFEELEHEYENADPLRKILEQEKAITQKQLELSKAMWLPKMELGYHYQGILGQTYNGIHTGISIPIWENKNTVKLQQSRLLHNELEIEDHRTAHFYTIKSLYEKYINLKISLSEYQTIFNTLNSTPLLNKALALGEINTITYFAEINFYNTAHYNYFQTEKEYYEVIAELYKYQL